MTNKLWYAITSDNYQQWDCGSYDINQAKQILLHEMEQDKSALIAAINENTNYCEYVIKYDQQYNVFETIK